MQLLLLFICCHVWFFCNPMDFSLPGSSVHGIFQARILEWIAISFFRGIFLTQGLNLCLLHWQVRFFFCFLFFFYHWAIGEAQPMQYLDINARPWRKRWNSNRMLQGKNGRLTSLIMFLPENYDDNKILIVYVNLHLQKGQETRFGG